MTNSAPKRTSVVGFFANVTLSAATMLWLFWHFPPTTAIATLVVFAAFEISACVSRLLEAEGKAQLEQRANHIAQ